MVFVIYLVEYTWLFIHFFAVYTGGRSRVVSSLVTATLNVFQSHSIGAVGLVDVCL